MTAAQGALKRASRLDQGLIVAGPLGFIWSLLPYYTLGPFSASAWHGFFGWAGALLGLAASVLVLLAIVRVAVPLATPPVIAGLFLLSLLFIFIALFVDAGSPIDLGRGVGYWLAFITALAAAGVACYGFAKDKQLI